MRSEQKTLIQRAAAVRHKTLTEFMLDAATEAAEEVLSSRQVFMADSEQFEAVLEIMDQPVAENPALQRMLRKPAPWEQ